MKGEQKMLIKSNIGTKSKLGLGESYRFQVPKKDAYLFTFPKNINTLSGKECDKLVSSTSISNLTHTYQYMGRVKLFFKLSRLKAGLKVDLSEVELLVKDLSTDKIEYSNFEAKTVMPIDRGIFEFLPSNASSVQTSYLVELFNANSKSSKDCILEVSVGNNVKEKTNSKLVTFDKVTSGKFAVVLESDDDDMYSIVDDCKMNHDFRYGNSGETVSLSNVDWSGCPMLLEQEKLSLSNLHDLIISNINFSVDSFVPSEIEGRDYVVRGIIKKYENRIRTLKTSNVSEDYFTFLEDKI